MLFYTSDIVVFWYLSKMHFSTPSIVSSFLQENGYIDRRVARVGYQTKRNKRKAEIPPREINLELQFTTLLIAQFTVNVIQTKIATLVSRYGVLPAVAFSSYVLDWLLQYMSELRKKRGYWYNSHLRSLLLESSGKGTFFINGFLLS